MKLIVISSPDSLKDESEHIITLFENGLAYFHLRKPGITKGKLVRILEKIPKQYHKRIIIYDHFELLSEYRLCGIHFNRKTIRLFEKYQHFDCHKSYSAHRLEELSEYDGLFDYIFISPVYDSISKSGYKASIDLAVLKGLIIQKKIKSEIIALGGVAPEKIEELRETGFSGVAVLGTLWNKYLENNDFSVALSMFKELAKSTQQERAFVLSIAGFDPSSGAGLSADLKTMETHAVYGISACTAITYQNDVFFSGLDWLSKEQIIQQIDILLNRYKVDFVKVGIIESFEVLAIIVDHLTKIKPGIKIIWDPVIKSSTGFDFHGDYDEKIFLSVLKKIYLITPNKTEYDRLFENIMSPNDYISENGLCNILLKGVPFQEDKIGDILFDGSEVVHLDGEKFEDHEKHGSGCVLSASITSLLALGYDLADACRNAKKYTEQYLLSTKTKIGYHNINE